MRLRSWSILASASIVLQLGIRMSSAMLTTRTPSRTIDPLHKWRLDLNNNTLFIVSLILMFQDKRFFLMNVRLRMYKYCCSNKGATYANGLYGFGVAILPEVQDMLNGTASPTCSRLMVYTWWSSGMIVMSEACSEGLL